MVLGPGLEAGRGFWVGVVSFWSFFIHGVFFFPEVVHEFSVYFADDY